LNGTYYSVVIGYNAGEFISSGSNNVCVGAYSGKDITTGNNNTCIGHQSGGGLETGSNNICIGNQSGSNLDIASNNNICIGNTGETSDNGVIRIGEENIHSETNLVGDIKLNSEKYTNGQLYVIDGKIMSGLSGHIKMSKHPDPDTRTGYAQFLVFKLKYTVIQNGLIDVTDSPAGFPLITVKVPGCYLVTVKGTLRDLTSLGDTARFRIVEENNVSNVYFREDLLNESDSVYRINVENRYGIMYDTNIQPYSHDIEFEMIKVT